MSAPTPHKMRILTVSVPPELYEQIQEVAAAEGRTKSEVMRAAFRHYQFTRSWRQIREWGAETAAELGIDSEEAVEDFLARREVG